MRNSQKFHSVTPVFVGGTGRSGTTILGELLGSHPHVYTSVPIEIKFLANRGGLLDVVFGRLNEEKERPAISLLNLRTRQNRRERELQAHSKLLDELLENIWKKWWSIDAPSPHGPGLIAGINEKQLHSLLHSYRNGFKGNRVKRARKFMRAFLRYQHHYGQERYWVETTPLNISNAHRLQELFPNALFINMVREPKDVIASLLTKDWGPESPIEGLDWIEKRLVNDQAALARVPKSRQLTISLEDLVIEARESTYLKLLNFLSLEDSPQMKNFFEEKMKAEAASSGRWRSVGFDQAFENEYQVMMNRLKKLGIK